jgi:DNA topoisomerase IB
VGRLRRVSCSEPGYTRRRCGRGWVYRDPGGERLSDPAVLARVDALVIPPAWTDVWICTAANGHLQAVGTDAKGRRQYRYHDAWRLARDRAKFDRMLDFGSALPGLRAACLEGLLEGGTEQGAVLAGAVRLLDLGCFRIGSDKSAEENETFGLTTLERRHVRAKPPAVWFDYPGKGGVHQEMAIADELAADLVLALKRRRGGDDRLLAWRQGPSGRWRTVTAAEVNGFIHEVTGGPFSAKDFRTLRATALAAGELSRLAEASASGASEGRRSRAITEVMRRTSAFLGNTPTVCRKSYVDPRVVDRYRAGHTVADGSPEVERLVASDTDLTATVPQAVLEGAVLPWLAEAGGDLGTRAA